jgi:hypothetical protein
MDARGEGAVALASLHMKCPGMGSWLGRVVLRMLWAPPHGRKWEVEGPEMGWTILQVKHLEVSSASMAEDLCRKSAIIETYVMDSRIGQCPSPALTYSETFTCPSFSIVPLLLFPS